LSNFDSPFFPVVKKILEESSSAEIADVLLNLFQQEDLIAKAGKLSFYSTDLQQWIHIDTMEQWLQKINDNLSHKVYYQQIQKEISEIKGTHILQFGLFQLPKELFDEKKCHILLNDSILQGGHVLQ
jgi:hypothetical protein